MAVWNIVNLKKIRPDRFDAEYFRPDYESNISNLKSTGELRSIGRLFKFIQRGTQPAYSENGKIKALRSVNVGNLAFNETRQEYVTNVFYDLTSRGHVKEDDILITSTGIGTLGRVSIWPYKEPAFCDGHISILRDSETNPYLIAAYLNSNYGKIQFDQNYRGSSGQIEIYPYDISRIVIPILILEYGGKIGSKVRRSFELISNSESLYSQATQLMEQELGFVKENLMRKNHYFTNLSACVNQKLIDSNFFQPKYDQIIKHLSSNFKLIELKKLAKIEYGYMPMQDYEVDPKKGIPLIRVTNITNNLEVKIDDLKYVPNWVKVSRNKFVEKGDILMVQCGDTTGKVGYIYEEIENYLFPSFCFSVKVFSSEIDSLFLAALLKTEIMQTLFDQTVMINTVRPNTTKPRFEKMYIPILRSYIQSEVNNLLMKSYELRKESKNLLEQAKTEIETLIENAVINAS